MPNPRAGHPSIIAALVAATVAASAAACANLEGDRPLGCEGARRPANPHGSLLSPDVSPAGAASASPSPCRGIAR